MSEDKKESFEDKIVNGGDIEFIDVASLAIATAIFISGGDDKVLGHIGAIADKLKEAFGSDEESNEN